MKKRKSKGNGAKALLMAFLVVLVVRGCIIDSQKQPHSSTSSRTNDDSYSSDTTIRQYQPTTYYLKDGTPIESSTGYVPEGYVYNGTYLIPKESGDNFYAVREYACLKESYPLYDWYRDDMCVIGYCEKNQIVYVSSTNGDYSHVFTSDNVDGYIPNSMLEYVPEEYLDQDISEQFVKVLKR
ncbi:MAG: hypothetical protein IJK66_01695 [Bacilli bacterium]|nr:hypothetical protein [Bacilli bacterium]